MAGGLIQIASYGSQELTLTGNPQITFFNIVFRRYTNFGIKTVEVSFDNPIDFGSISTLTIPQIGDLLTKTTLKIKLPSYDLTNINNQIVNNLNESDINIDFEKYYLYYDFFINFINKLKNIVNTFFKQTNNNYKTITYVSDLPTFILKFINESEYIQFFNIVNFYLYSGIEPQNSINNNLYTNTFTNASLFYLNNKILTYIYNNYNANDITYEQFEFLILKNMEILDELNVVIYDKFTNIFKKNNTITMSWIKKIGIFIFDYVQLYMGSNLVSLASPNYMDIYGQLNYKNVEIYNKMIGNDIKLNTPTITNNETFLYVPIPFWYNNNYGMAIPLIALQFNNIQLKIKIKELKDVIYFNITKIGSYINENIRESIVNLIFSNIKNIFETELEITALLEYVFLDNMERKKFAQSSHEYLITQVQEVVFNNVSQSESNFELDFFHCCKSMFWSANQYKYINNITGNNIYDKYTVSLYKPTYSISNNMYANYLRMLYYPFTLFNLDIFLEGLNVINTSPFDNNNFIQDLTTSMILNQNFKNYEVTPFLSSTISLGSYELVSQESPYFNYLHPYNYYKNTPDIGINVYSFSLNPTENQPSGTCNFSRINKTSIKFKMLNPDDNLVDINTNESYNILDNLSSLNLNNYKVYVGVENYNILRFIGGIVAVAYTY